MFPDKAPDSLTGFDWGHLTKKYVDTYEQLDRDYSHIYRMSSNRLVQLSRIGPGCSVIDIGTGTGTSALAAWQAMKSQGKLLAIEPSSMMLRRAEARRDLTGVIFRQGAAKDVAGIASSIGIAGRVDGVISNFTYYYTYEGRQELHQQIHSVLAPGGRWAFNITHYLGQLRIRGKVYNHFAPIFERQLRVVAQRYAVQTIEDVRESESDQFNDTRWEERWLERAGFTSIEVEAWPLPLTPSEAYRFTIDGFFRHGSKIGFAPWIMHVPLDRRIQILLDTLTDCTAELDRFPPPYIANFAAARPSA